MHLAEAIRLLTPLQPQILKPRKLKSYCVADTVLVETVRGPALVSGEAFWWTAAID
jgi:hypothetical protein